MVCLYRQHASNRKCNSMKETRAPGVPKKIVLDHRQECRSEDFGCRWVKEPLFVRKKNWSKSATCARSARPFGSIPTLFPIEAGVCLASVDGSPNSPALVDRKACLDVLGRA